MGLKNVVQAVSSELLYRTGLLDLVGLCKRGHVTVLSFHCVSGPGRRYFRDGMNIDADHFADVVRMLRKRYRILSLAEAAAELASGRRRFRSVAVLTFDDGYRDNYVHAFPVLKETGTPATIFLPTDYIGTGRLLWWDEVSHVVGHAPGRVLPLIPGARDANAAISHMKYLPVPDRDRLLNEMREAAGDVPPPARLMLDWNEVAEMAEAGIDFGSHTVTHPYLDAIGADRLRHELERSRTILEERLRQAPVAIAYPDGRHSPEVVAAAKAAGYTCAVTTVSGPNRGPCDPFLLKRYDGSLPFTAGGRRVRFPVLWSELLGVWDVGFLRKWRTPERFTTYRPTTTLAARRAAPPRELVG